MASDAQALLLQVSADTSKAEKRLKAFEDKLKGVGRTVDKISNDNQRGLSNLFGNPGKGLDQIFDSTRLRALDTGAARIGITGSALEKFGVIGLGAAAGIAAVAVALNQAKQAMTFADELSDTAARLHVTTDALQEYRYAIRLAGGEEKGADEALASFSETLGKAQAGLPKALRGFQELGFTKDQVKSFQDTDTALKAVTERISGLGKNQQKDAVVSQLGLTGIKELVEGGADQMARLRKEAHDAGVVMDSGLVKRAAETNEKFTTLTKVIDIQLKSAFVDLIPVLTTLLGFIAQMARMVGDIVDGFRSIENKTTQGLQDQVARLQGQRAAIAAGREPAPRVSFGQGVATPSQVTQNALGIGATRDQRLKELDDKIAAAQAQLAQRAKDAAPPAVPHGPNRADLSAGEAAKKAAEQEKRFDDELARIQGQILAASDNERHSFEERAAIARERLEDEIKARDKSVDNQVKTGSITEPRAKILRAENAVLAATQRRELAAEQAQAQADLQLRLDQEMSDAIGSALQAQLGLAKTAESRAALEDQIAKQQSDANRDALVKRLAADRNISEAQAVLEVAIYDQATADQAAARSAKHADEIAADRLSVDQAAREAQIQGLQLLDQLAETQAEHRDIQLRILDIQYDKERAELEGLTHAKAISDTDRAIAQKKLDQLNADHPGQRQSTLNNTRGPLGQFLAGLPLDPKKLDEALQNVATHGLQSLEDGLVAVIGHTKKLGDVFREVASQIVADLARIAIQRAIIGPLESVLGATFGALPGLGNLIGGGKAIGGPVFPGHIYPINEKGLEGFVPGVAGTVIPHDAIRAAATAGGGRSVTVLQTVQFDARGALMFKDYTLQQNRQMVALAGAAAQQATRASLAGTPGSLAQFNQHAG